MRVFAGKIVLNKEDPFVGLLMVKLIGGNGYISVGDLLQILRTDALGNERYVYHPVSDINVGGQKVTFAGEGQLAHVRLDQSAVREGDEVFKLIGYRTSGPDSIGDTH